MKSKFFTILFINPNSMNVKTYSMVMAVVAMALTVAAAVSFGMRSMRGITLPAPPKVVSVQSPAGGSTNKVATQKVTLPANTVDQKVTVK